MTQRTKLATLIGIAAALMLSICFESPAQEKDKAAAKKIAVRAGRLIDGKSDAPILNALIVIEGDKIVFRHCWRNSACRSRADRSLEGHRASRIH